MWRNVGENHAAIGQQICENRAVIGPQIELDETANQKRGVGENEARVWLDEQAETLRCGEG